MRKKKDFGKLGEIVQQIREKGKTFKEGAEAFGVPVQHLYDYNHWVKNQGRQKDVVGKKKPESEAREREGDTPSSAKEKVPDAQVPEEIQELILAYRTEHPDHGFKKIEDHLKSRHFLVIPRKKIREVLKAHGKLETQDSSLDREEVVRTAKGMRRFEACYPRELLQMDVTYVYLSGRSVLYLVVIVDDYSRFCVGAKLCGDQKGVTMIEALHEAINRYGKPKKLLTDQGSSFYSWGMNPTVFQQYLDDMGIEHIVADPHSPQTLGKVERLNQTLKRELLTVRRFAGEAEARTGIEAFIQGYNYERNHQGIGGARPADRFHGVIEETSRIERELATRELDFSKGYLVLRTAEHSLSLVSGATGLQVFVNGKPWREAES